MARATMTFREIAGRMLILVSASACALPEPAVLPSPPVDTVQTLRFVNTGYGMVPRRTQTGSVGSLVVDDRDLAAVGRTEQLLEGRIPGVTVDRLANGDYSIHIRGSLGGTNGGEPLIVVDGIPAPPGVSSRVALGSINPGVVTRIDVLKDAGTTAAYGSRGSHGVILITTRR